MESIKDRVAKATKEKLGELLTATKWEPEAGGVLMGELVHREFITRKEDQKTYDKVTLRCDEGLYDTIIKTGILALSQPPVVKGDILVVTYKGLVPIGKAGRTMHDSSVTIYHTGEQETAPF